MDDPQSNQKSSSFLPALIENNYQLMLHEGILNERQKAFFVDIRLEKFWKSVDKYLGSIKCPELAPRASLYLIYCFILPLPLYGETGTRERPIIKTERIDRQRKADELRKSAADHARQLSSILKQLEDLESDNPETMLLMYLIEPLVGGTGYYRGELAVNIGLMRTSRTIDFLEKSFRDYPDTDELFSGSPGMCSNKASWRDWFREVNWYLMNLLNNCPGELNIRETDWVKLVNVLVDETTSRSSVSDELHKWPLLREQFQATDELEKLPWQRCIPF